MKNVVNSRMIGKCITLGTIAILGIAGIARESYLLGHAKGTVETDCSTTEYLIKRFKDFYPEQGEDFVKNHL